MPIVNTNETQLTFVEETTFGVPAALGWFQLQVAPGFNFGSTITTENPEIINKKRQQIKGAITDLESEGNFEAPFSIGVIDRFMGGLFSAIPVNNEVFFPVASVDDLGLPSVPGSIQYRITSASAAQVAKIVAGTGTGSASLFFARNFSNPANNGLVTITAAPTVGNTKLTTSGVKVTETATVDQGAMLEYAGVRFTAPAGPAPVWTYSAGTKTATLDRGAAFNWGTAGITPGQFIMIGSVSNAGSVQFAGQNTIANDSYGYARVLSISSNGQILTLDKLSSRLQRAVTFPSAGSTDIMFGKFVRNVDTDSAEYKRVSYQAEVRMQDLYAPGTPGYEYSVGNYLNTMEIKVEAAALAKVSLSFIGRDTDVITSTRKTGASVAVRPRRTNNISGVADIMRLRVTELDEDGLTTDVGDMTLKFENGIEGEKVVGFLGNKYLSQGTFKAMLEGTVLFTNPDVPAAIRTYATLTADAIFRSSDGTLAVDFPNFAMSGGEKDFEANKIVKIAVECSSYEDERFATSASFSLFSQAFPVENL